MLKPRTNVAVAVPSKDKWTDDFGMCLVNMFIHLMTKPMPGVQLGLKLMNERSSLLPQSRHRMIQQAMAADMDYLLFIDEDQTFPSNLLYRLLKHQEPLVACNVATKSIPSSPTARSFNPKYFGGNCVFTDEGMRGLEEVWRVGCGIMLVDLSIMAKVAKPWFEIRYDEETDSFVGEDWYFCGRVAASGFKIYVDHGVSWEVGHIGKLEYTHELVGEVIRQEDAEIRQRAENGTLIVN